MRENDPVIKKKMRAELSNADFAKILWLFRGDLRGK